MKAKLERIVGPVIVAALFGAAVWFLYGELEQHSLEDFLRELGSFAPVSLLEAAGFTALSYLALTTHDLLALRYVRKRLGYATVALGSFVGYAFSSNMGLGALGGGAVRYRIYGPRGLSGGQVAKVAVFCVLTFWAGFLALGGSLFASEQVALPSSLGLPFETVLPLGIVCLTALAAYLLATLVRKEPIGRGKWRLELPSFALAGGQVIAGAAQIFLLAAVVYVLLPAGHGMSYLFFLTVFLVAHAGSVLTHVPGGLGVLEAGLFLLLPEHISRPALVGSLLAFRGIYYLAPLLAAMALLAGHEVARKRKGEAVSMRGVETR